MVVDVIKDMKINKPVSEEKAGEFLKDEAQWV